MSHTSPEMVDREVIAILGADCRLGERIIDISLRSGFQVQALARTSIERSSDPYLRLLRCESPDARQIRTVVRGSTCVINLSNLQDPRRLAGILRNSVISRHVIEAMGPKPQVRYLLVTHPSIRMPDDQRLGLNGLLSRPSWRLRHRQRYRELQEETELVRESAANWTIVRCPRLKNDIRLGSIRVSRRQPTGRYVATDRLARYLIHLKDSENYDRKAIFVSSGHYKKAS